MIKSVVPGSTDPFDNADVSQLRRELLQLRDAVIGGRAHAEVLKARVDDLERELAELDEHAQSLQRTVNRSLAHQARRVIRRLRRPFARS